MFRVIQSRLCGDLVEMACPRGLTRTPLDGAGSRRGLHEGTQQIRNIMLSFQKPFPGSLSRYMIEKRDVGVDESLTGW
jgi:hypothetical protein